MRHQRQQARSAGERKVTKDVAGQRFGSLTALCALNPVQAKKMGLRDNAYWLCRCDCGEGAIVSSKNLKVTTLCADCGARKRAEALNRERRLDITGHRYGALLAIRFDHIGRAGDAHWLFACDCGGEKVIPAKYVRHGNTLSCGCLKYRKNRPRTARSFEGARPWFKPEQAQQQ